MQRFTTTTTTTMDQCAEHESPLVQEPQLQPPQPQQKQHHIKRTLFPVILFSMLEDAATEGFEDVVSWNQNGRCFKVHDREQFLQSILPRYSKLTHFKSYVRQLNLWGFSCIHGGRANPNRGSYQHANFIRGHPDLCRQIFRRNKSTRKANQGTDFEGAQSTKNRLASLQKERKGNDAKTAVVPVPAISPSDHQTLLLDQISKTLLDALQLPHLPASAGSSDILNPASVSVGSDSDRSHSPSTTISINASNNKFHIVIGTSSSFDPISPKPMSGKSEVEEGGKTENESVSTEPDSQCSSTPGVLSEGGGTSLDDAINGIAGAIPENCGPHPYSPAAVFGDNTTADHYGERISSCEDEDHGILVTDGIFDDNEISYLQDALESHGSDMPQVGSRPGGTGGFEHCAPPALPSRKNSSADLFDCDGMFFQDGDNATTSTNDLMLL